MRTQVAIVGAGPSGLLLSHLLALRGIESVIVENRSRDYVLSRVRAGVLEAGAVATLTDAGLAERLHREGLRHDGIYLQWPGERHRIDFQDLCGNSVWVYGQTELTKDLIAIRQEAGQQILWEISNTRITDADSSSPRVTVTDRDGNEIVIDCDLIAGCDGFHGVSRGSIPSALRTTVERTYPFAWLGILAEVAPSTDELIYAWHPQGFAMHSMRSTSISRLYLQVDPADDIANWPDDRIWSELRLRLGIDGWELASGPTLEKSITPMRSFVSTPMRYGRLLIAGDASHIVPPTGAKGLNLAIADVTRLAAAMASSLLDGDDHLLDRYSDDAMSRVWQATHFSWWMTSMLHTPADDADAEFTRRLQLTQLQGVVRQRTAAQYLAERYTGVAL